MCARTDLSRTDLDPYNTDFSVLSISEFCALKQIQTTRHHRKICQQDRVQCRVQGTACSHAYSSVQRDQLP
jgi:hypothetical protein